MEIEKVDHITESHPVNEVPNCPTGYQAQCERPPASTFGQVPIKKTENHHRNDRHCKEKRNSECRISSGQKSKRCPGIANVGQAEKITNHRHGFTVFEMGKDQDFRPLIQNHHQNNRDKKIERLFHGRSTRKIPKDEFHRQSAWKDPCFYLMWN